MLFRSGEIVGAFSITGPSFRITDKNIAQFGRLVLEEARLASGKLGSSTAEQAA